MSREAVRREVNIIDATSEAVGDVSTEFVRSEVDVVEISEVAEESRDWT